MLSKAYILSWPAFLNALLVLPVPLRLGAPIDRCIPYIFDRSADFGRADQSKPLQ